MSINSKLIICVVSTLMLVGCATPIPVAVTCPKMPLPPPELMTPPPTQNLLQSAQ